MKVTITQMGKTFTANNDGTVTITKIKEPVKFNHDKFAEFDKWFAKFEKKYVEYQENKYY